MSYFVLCQDAGPARCFVSSFLDCVHVEAGKSVNMIFGFAFVSYCLSLFVRVRVFSICLFVFVCCLFLTIVVKSMLKGSKTPERESNFEESCVTREN